jgi:hypothetical protein
MIANRQHDLLQAGKRWLFEYGEHGAEGLVYESIHVGANGVPEQRVAGSFLPDEQDEVDAVPFGILQDLSFRESWLRVYFEGYARICEERMPFPYHGF